MTTRSQEAAADVAALLRARNPLIWIVTPEEARVESYLFEAAASAKYVARTWDCGQGVAEMDGKPAPQYGSDDIDNTLTTIRARATSTDERCMWIMRDLPPWLNGPIGISSVRKVRNLARLFPTLARNRAQAIVILSPNGDVPPELSNHATVLDWPLPDREEIAALLDDQIESLPDELKEAALVNGARDAAIDAAIGLSGEEAQACYSRSIVQLKTIDPAIVSKEKKRVIGKERTLEWFDPLPGGLDAVGGLDVLKTWLISRKLAYSSKAREYGLPAPKGAMLIGIPGCLRGDTPIYDPVKCETRTARQRWEAAEPFNVWARDANGNPVVAIALPPVKYGKENMIEFSLDNGETITVTEKHRFISDGVELFASEVYEQLQVSGPCLLETISGTGLRVRFADARRSTQTPQASQGDCQRGREQARYGEQPHSVADIYQAGFPSRDGVRAHTLGYLRKGDLDTGEGHSRTCLSSVLLSRHGYRHPSSAQSKTEYHALAHSFEPVHDKLGPEMSSVEQQSPAALSLSDTDQRPLDNGRLSISSSGGYTRVRTARRVPAEEYFDFHVPGYENYWACGLWHHNCGKSLTAKAIATAWQVPLLRVDLGALKSKFVGESEGNLRRAFKVIEAIGRCVIWLDEIEKSLSGATSGAADGGVSSDALGFILSWMQERSGEAFVIATANKVESLPPELLRKGRFDEIFWVDLPNASERAEIAKAALRQHGRGRLKFDYKAIADATEEFTGSEIAAIVPEALFAAFANKGREITTADLLNAAGNVTPLARTMGEQIDKLRNWAQGKARPATTLEAETSRKAARRTLDL